MSGKLFVVVGGQFGSEGKGAVAGRICADMGARGQSVINVRVGGPNAGHTVLGVCPDGCTGEGAAAHEVGRPHPWRLRQVPVAAVTNPDAQLIIAAGSEVDLDVLSVEIDDLDSAGYNVSGRLLVDSSATLLTKEHRDQEAENELAKRLGSTAKGIGAARVDRLWRTADLFGKVDTLFGPDARDISSNNTADNIAHALRNDYAVVVEGTQGYGLGLHTEHYPFTTSGDCRAIDFLAQAGISPWMASGPYSPVDLKVVVCLRPYPIRVAGNSGELAGETDWETLGLPVEYTTVTQKVRRVGSWDTELAQSAIRANGGPREGVVWVALTMMDSVSPDLSGANHTTRGWRSHNIPAEAAHHMRTLGLTSSHLGYVGTGPQTAIVNQDMYA